ncbi:hypothetical protein BN7_5455 [Wickerhamomyces ciferrii]|uniref:Uncharacterized protein n=1 Tax=Wickerhamomyces ciferrii (strain ATCC 14091 / BCRC 22168 / CBS 111 / JCM 3599 / NBRC 0793 / NRRL Y-1031 F-60-10) TaxID=1206466 RepID=K0KXS5_WICCF|nr:uncharacterized protein BN7_5455 [Wickerhamomyces ciferrii]CCH45868.1 hypothetical protein BN7_5455 [Wickerhamomyces ciferrii]
MNSDDENYIPPELILELQIWLLEKQNEKTFTIEFQKTFKKGYLSHVLLSNNDTLRHGKFTKLLLGFYGLGPLRRFEERYPIIARQIVGDSVKGLELSPTIDNVIHKYKGIFDLMPYEKYSTSFFVKRSNIHIAQMMAHLKIKAKHSIWNTKLKFIYPVRYVVNKSNQKFLSLVSCAVTKVSKFLKKNLYRERGFELFSLGDNPSLLGPFPVEIWLIIIKEANITSKQSAGMFYNSYWIDIIGPYLYTNIYGIVTIRDTFIINRDEGAFFKEGPSYSKGLLYCQERYDRYQDLANNKYETLDLYPSSPERKHRLENLKSKFNGFPITYVKNHESILKLAALNKIENSLMRKYTEQLSIDIFAPQDFMTKEGASELYDDYRKVYSGFQNVEVESFTLVSSFASLIHVLHEFKTDKTHDEASVCEKNDEVQPCFQKEKRWTDADDDFFEFTNPNYDIELSYFNRILNSILKGRREDIMIYKDPTEDTEFMEFILHDHARYRNLDRINHKFDLQVFKRKFLQDRNSVKLFIDNITRPFSTTDDKYIDVSVTITGFHGSRSNGRCLADHCGHLTAIQPEPQMVVLRKVAD